MALPGVWKSKLISRSHGKEIFNIYSLTPFGKSSDKLSEQVKTSNFVFLTTVFHPEITCQSGSVEQPYGNL